MRIPDKPHMWPHPYEGTHLWLVLVWIISKCIYLLNNILLCQYPLTVVDLSAQHSSYKSCLPTGPTRFWSCRPDSKFAGLGPTGRRKNRTLATQPQTQTQTYIRADSRFAPSQWETALLCNDVSHWLGANLESALYMLSTSPDKRWRHYLFAYTLQYRLAKG